MLILSKYIVKNELKPLLKKISLKDLVFGAQKVQNGLGVKIKSFGNKPFTFYKVRIGSRAKARMIVFVVTKSLKVVPVLIRLKKDKKLGMNMSANNPAVIAQVEVNLDNILKDIENGNFEEINF